MPKAKVEKIQLQPIMQGGKIIGFGLTGVITFADFGEDREGRDWALPLRARGNPETQELAGTVVDGVWHMPADYKTNEDYEYLSDADDKPLYVCKDGSLVNMPYLDGTKTPSPLVVLDARKATDWRQFNTSLTPEFAWPDGRVRKLRFTIKANNPMDAAEAAKQKADRKRRLLEGSVKGAKTTEEIDAMIDAAMKRRAELAVQA